MTRTRELILLTACIAIWLFGAIVLITEFVL